MRLAFERAMERLGVDPEVIAKATGGFAVTAAWRGSRVA